MSRLQLFEFDDQPWLKGFLREAYFDALSLAHKVGQPYRKIAQEYQRWALSLSNPRVLDLASGGGGHIEYVLSGASAEFFKQVEITLSDLFPHPERYAELAEKYPNLSFQSSAVDAFDLPEPLRVLPGRSLFTAVHHFEPAMITDLLRGAARDRKAVFIADFVSRDLGCLIGCTLGQVLVMFLAPLFAKRFGWKKFLFTTIIPLIPLLMAWDGIVSCLRSYSVADILELIPESAADCWTISSGSKSYFIGCRVIYLALVPKN